jgi:Transposase DDE domain
VRPGNDDGVLKFWRNWRGHDDVTAYGSGANLNWLVNEAKIAPHIPVVDKSKREDGTFSREDFTFDKEQNVYTCPAGKVLTTTGKLVNDGDTLLYLARTRDCRSCAFKAQCCPKTPFRRIQRSIYEEGRDVARALAKTEAFERSRRDRKRVEMLFAHLKRIFRLGRLETVSFLRSILPAVVAWPALSSSAVAKPRSMMFFSIPRTQRW